MSMRASFGFVLLLAGASQAATPPWQQQPLLQMLPGDTLALPPLDIAKAHADDDGDKATGRPPRVGLVAAVDDAGVSGKLGDWSRLPDGRLSWRLAVDGPNARALDFAFKRFRLPAGAELWIRSVDGHDWIGPFSDRDNTADGRFYTPLLKGERAIIELIVPADRRDFVELELEGVSRHYRDLFTATLQKSGSCNIDVACPAGDPYRDQINSVAHYSFRTGGSTYVCTGTLASATDRTIDQTTPNFLTANHCVSTAAEVQSMVFYWRYESPTCRAPGSAASGTPLNRNSNTAATQSGATLRATHQATDFTVVRLNAPVPAAANAFFAGWDRSGSIPGGSVGIHHPAGDEKRISINTDPLTVMPSCILSGTPNNTHWRVNNWEQGTTEQGSSGSGLFRPDSKRLIGVLSGGQAACGVLSYDCYGRLSVAWDGGGTAASRARDWLDPANTGVQTHDAAATPSLAVTLASDAFTSLAAAGDTIQITATATGGSGGYTYQWDVDGDGVFDRRGSERTVTLSYAARTSTQVTVRVTDGGGMAGQVSRALDVRGPVIVATSAGQPVQLHGNGNATMDPGETWQLPVRLTNTGDDELGAGSALFAASAAAGGAATPFGPDAFGYVGATSTGAQCGFSFVDLRSGAHATPVLALDDDDDGRSDTITLGGNGVLLYGQRHAQAVMSTNGYVSFDANESGEDYDNSCTVGPDRGALGPQLRPLHDDLLVGDGSGAGLRYRYFASCPRPAEVNVGNQGCHVFQWSRMERWSNGGDFEFQTIAYAQTGQVVHQYLTADPEMGGSANIGIINSNGTRLDVGCNETIATARSAVCIFAPSALPGAAGNAARVGTPVLPLAGLGSGASTTVNVQIDIADDAACGSGIAVEHIASASPGVHSFGRQSVFNGSVGASCTRYPRPVIGTPPPRPMPRAGMYFDPARDGTGVNAFFVPQTGDRMIVGGLWYTGLPDRTPAWYLLSGDVYGWGGKLDLLRFTNSAAPNGFAPVSSSAGDVWVGYDGDGGMMLAWEIGGRGGAERMQSIGLPYAVPNHTAPWYPPSQDGWGITVESLNTGGSNTLEFVAAFLYDASGQPRWGVGARESVTGGSFAMTGLEPQCPGCPRFADVQERTSALGTLTINYQGTTSATLGSQLTLPGPWSGSWNRSGLPIVPIVNPTAKDGSAE